MQKTFTRSLPRRVPVTLAILLMLTLLLKSLPAAAQTDAKRTAREHFDRGVAAFADKRFGEAADEFETAYRIEPVFQVLYNIGQVDVALGRSVEAVDTFEEYLKQGGAAIADQRRREVRTEIDKQSARIGTVTVTSHPSAVEVRVDGRPIGKTPLGGPIRVNPGRHTVEAMLAGHVTQVRAVEVAAKASVVLELALEAIPAPRAAAPSPAPVAPAAVVLTPRAVSPAPVAAAPQAASVNWQRISGLIMVAGGLATGAVGGLLVYDGANQASDARDQLVALGDPRTFSDPKWNDSWNAADARYTAGRSRNRRGWIVAGVGAAVLTGGLLFLVTAPERTAGGGNALALSPWLPIEPGDRGGLVLGGDF